MRVATYGIEAALPNTTALTQGQPYPHRSARPVESPSETRGTGGVLDSANVGPMKIGRFCAQRACIVTHPVVMPRNSPDFVMIAVQLRGTSVLDQFGRSMRLMPGDWGLCDAPKPCISTHSAGAEQLHFLIPQDHVRLSIDPRFVIGRRFSSDSGVSALMVQAMTSLFEELPSLGAGPAEDLADVVVRLFHIAAQQRIERPRHVSVHDEMRKRICTVVENHLRDPRLSLEMIATELKCTKRYLHLVFATQDQTLNQYIWNRRLARCRRELEDPASNARSITQVAMSWGFSNLSHFSRAFRDHFGLSPREVRAGTAPTV
jgi:AraC family transcriptional regulator, positive regulator of tynA and feaB